MNYLPLFNIDLKEAFRFQNKYLHHSNFFIKDSITSALGMDILEHIIQFIEPPLNILLFHLSDNNFLKV